MQRLCVRLTAQVFNDAADAEALGRAVLDLGGRYDQLPYAGVRVGQRPRDSTRRTLTLTQFPALTPQPQCRPRTIHFMKVPHTIIRTFLKKKAVPGS